MAAGKLDITIEEGADFFLFLTWLDNDGNAKDISSYTARMKIKESVVDAGEIDNLTSGTGEITLGGTAGTIQIDIAAGVTANYDFDWGVYDLELISAGGVVTRLIEGAVKFSREVTT